MTVIHVTIDDHAEALGVVATLLNQGYVVAIDLDIVAQPEMSADEWDRLYGDNHKRATMKRSERKRNVPALERHDLIHDLPAKEWDKINRALDIVSTRAMTREERNAEYERLNMERLGMNRKEYDAYIQAKLQARAERYMDVEQHLVVGCPSCGANPGNYCVAAAGSNYKQFVHVDRRHALNTLNTAVPADG